MKKSIRLLSASLAAAVLLSSMFAQSFSAETQTQTNADNSSDTPASLSLNSDYLIGTESESYAVDSSLYSDISTKNSISLDFTDGNTAEKTVTELFVEYEEKQSSDFGAFAPKAALTDNGLQMSNHTTGTALNITTREQTAQLNNIYTLRSNYKIGEIDYIKAVVELPLADLNGSSTVGTWARNGFYLVLGKTEYGLSGIRIMTTGEKKISVDSVLWAEDGSITVGQSLAGFSDAVSLEINVHYDYYYTTSQYRYVLDMFTLDENGEYTGTSKNFTFNSNAQWTKVRDMNECMFGFAVSGIDNDKFRFAARLQEMVVEFSNNFDDETEFRTNNTLALKLEENVLSYQDKPCLENAIAAYEKLPLREKAIFRSYYFTWQKYLEKITEFEAAGQLDEEIVRAADDYSVWTDNFTDYAMRKWYNRSSTAGKFRFTYDETLQKNVLDMRTQTVYQPKSYTLPKNSAYTVVNFKMKAYGKYKDVYNMWTIQLWYEDDNNYATVSFGGNNVEDGTFRYIYQGKVDGNYITNGTGHIKLGAIDLASWTDVTIEKNGQKCVINLISGEESTTISVVLPTERCNIGFSGVTKAVYDGVESGILYTDFEMHTEKSSYVPDTQNYNINAYYTGNTVHNSGDTVTVIGEDLANNVNGLEIARVSDAADTNSTAFLRELAYDVSNEAFETDSDHTYSYYSYLDQYEGSAEFERLSTELSWQDLAVLQYTEDSIKFYIPAEFEKGIYAVKLKARYDSVKDMIIYINNPDLDYYVGDQGDVITPGGTMQIIGKNTVLDSEKLYVQMKNSSVTKNFTVADGCVTVDSAYSVIVDIPSDMPEGSYEVTVYNGYGDGSCISKPLKATIGPDPRASWSQYTINIKEDMGASGVKTENATGYFITALEMLAAKGGGTLYLPNGTYCLMHSIVVPENVRIVGEDAEKVYIQYLPLHWNIGELPEYLIAYKQNVSFENFSILASRNGNLFTCFGTGDLKNVYFDNIRYQKWTFTGTPTNAAEGSGTILYGYTANEVYLILYSEQRTHACCYWYFPTQKTINWINNWKCTNLDTYITGSMTMSNTYFSKVKNARFENCSWEVTGNTFFSFNGSNIIYKDNVYDGCAGSINGENTYYTNVEMGNVSGNNHELAVADEGLSWGADSTGIITPTKGDTTGLWYEMKGKSYSDGAAVGLMVAVAEGQGRGQTRTIVANTGSSIKIDSPFEVAPTANSRVVLESNRHNNYFVNCYFHNGACCGYFGDCTDVIFDGNKYRQTGEQVMHSRVSMTNWYFSFVNESYADPMYQHTTGAGDQSGNCALVIYSKSGRNYLRGGLVRNCSFDGYYLQVYQGVLFSDVVVENNSFKDYNLGTATLKNSVGDGTVYRNNTFDNCDVGYLTYSTTGNKQGSKCMIIVMDGKTEFSLGDVNLDGSITVKDVTVLRYYLIGKTTLTTQQLSNADVYKDSVINTKDVTILRRYIIGEITSFDEVEIDTGSSSSASSTSSSASSSGSSSSSPSSSESSSSGSSSASSSSSSSSSTSSATIGSDSGNWYPGVY